jgi:hypothetical protein
VLFGFEKQKENVKEEFRKKFLRLPEKYLKSDQTVVENMLN